MYIHYIYICRESALGVLQAELPFAGERTALFESFEVPISFGVNRTLGITTMNKLGHPICGPHGHNNKIAYQHCLFYCQLFLCCFDCQARNSKTRKMGYLGARFVLGTANRPGQQHPNSLLRPADDTDNSDSSFKHQTYINSLEGTPFRQ